MLPPTLLSLAAASLSLPSPTAPAFTPLGGSHSQVRVCRRPSLHLLKRRSHIRLCDAEDLELEIPLYDPLSDEVPFPFPSGGCLGGQVFRYVFDRPVYLRMLRAACGSDSGLSETDGTEPRPIIGHCVWPGDGPPVASLTFGPDSTVRVGTIGAALQLLSVEFGESTGPQAAFSPAALSQELAVVRARAAFRFEVAEVTGTIPYPKARVRRVRDAPLETDAERARAAELEAALVTLLSKLVQLSSKLEAAGPMAAAASDALRAPAELLQAHEEAVLGGEYRSATERWEAISLAVCEVVDLPHDVAAAALACRSPIERLELLLASMRPALAEMAALASIDAVGTLGEPEDGGAEGAPRATLGEKSSWEGGLEGFTPIEIPVGGGEAGGTEAKELPDGARIEYWWNEEYGWCAATVRRKLRTAEGLLHTLEFDIDSTWEDLPLTAGRWRPLRY
ncbi:hypothetical protein AB1Y20_022168 [Prymnesium parvum]|uniref:Uncharacterized protein n=1 Tax=Prymnesium parvum TaxID=97485 RepID=A0AB34JHK6_PRYPA